MLIAIFILLLQAGPAFNGNSTPLQKDLPALHNRSQQQFSTSLTNRISHAENVQITHTIVSSFRAREQRHLHDGLLSQPTTALAAVFLHSPLINTKVIEATPISHLLLFPKHHFW